MQFYNKALFNWSKKDKDKTKQLKILKKFSQVGEVLPIDQYQKQNKNK